MPLTHLDAFYESRKLSSEYRNRIIANEVVLMMQFENAMRKDPLLFQRVMSEQEMKENMALLQNQYHDEQLVYESIVGIMKNYAGIR